MIDLTRLCGPRAAAALTLDQLTDRCNSYILAWGLSQAKIGFMIAGAVLIGLFVCIRRIKKSEDAGVVLGNTFEGALYGALSVWAGSSAGLILALLFPPAVMGAMLLVFPVLSMLIMTAALVKGTASGMKVAGTICLLILAAGLVVAAVFGFMVPGRGSKVEPAYERYLWAVSVTFAFTGLAGALIVSLFHGYHWAAGWFLVPVNASWGSLGNLLGLMNHLASLLFFDDFGKVQETRLFYIRYDAGFHLKSGYDFTEGDAMSGNNVVPHESVHVLQHFIFGPLYPLSHAAWMALMFVPGVIAGMAKRSDAGAGITDLTYYNNPWEVFAYAFACRRNDGTTTLIFNDVVAWIITVLWILGATAAAIVFFAARG